MILFLSNRRLFTIKYSFLWIMYIDINCQNMDKFTDTKMTNLWCFKERVPADLILIKCSKNRYLNDPPVCIWICCRDWSIIFYIICVARIKVEVASWNKMLAVTWPEMVDPTCTVNESLVVLTQACEKALMRHIMVQSPLKIKMKPHVESSLVH